jgi:hypothetical protein
VLTPFLESGVPESTSVFFPQVGSGDDLQDVKWIHSTFLNKVWGKEGKGGERRGKEGKGGARRGKAGKGREKGGRREGEGGERRKKGEGRGLILPQVIELASSLQLSGGQMKAAENLCSFFSQLTSTMGHGFVSVHLLRAFQLKFEELEREMDRWASKDVKEHQRVVCVIPSFILPSPPLAPLAPLPLASSSLLFLLSSSFLLPPSSFLLPPSSLLFLLSSFLLLPSSFLLSSFPPFLPPLCSFTFLPVSSHVVQAEVEESLYHHQLRQRNSLSAIYLAGVCAHWLSVDEMKKLLKDFIYLIAYQQRHWKYNQYAVIGKCFFAHVSFFFLRIFFFRFFFLRNFLTREFG